MSDPNEIKEYSDGCLAVCLYNRKSEQVAEALFDKDDLNIIKNHKWCLDNHGYVKNSKNKYLHRILTNEQHQYVDHINGNTLDNRRDNLRICTNADNLKNRVNLPKNNTSGILGVRFRSDRNKWYSEIQYNGKSVYLGSYNTKEEAIKSRVEAELKYFKEYKSKILNNEIN